MNSNNIIVIHQNPSLYHTAAHTTKIDLCQKSGSTFFDIHSITVKNVYTAVINTANTSIRFFAIFTSLLTKRKTKPSKLNKTSNWLMSLYFFVFSFLRMKLYFLILNTITESFASLWVNCAAEV